MTKLEKQLELIEAKRCDINHFIETEAPVAVRLTWLSLVLGGLTALFTGVPALGGKAFFDVLGLPAGSLSWRLVLVSAAVLSTLSTIVAGVLKHRQSETRIGQAQAALAKLEGLAARLEADPRSTDPKTIGKAITEYSAIAVEIPFVQGLKPQGFGKFGLQAKIRDPSAGQKVDEAIECSGHVKPPKPTRGLHFWLMVEVRDEDGDTRVWPKEGELYVKKDGSWQHTIYEDGGTSLFDVGLYVASREAHARIGEWLDAGKRGAYRPVQGFPSCQRLHRVKGLVLPSPGEAYASPPRS